MGNIQNNHGALAAVTSTHPAADISPKVVPSRPKEWSSWCARSLEVISFCGNCTPEISEWNVPSAKSFSGHDLVNVQQLMYAKYFLSVKSLWPDAKRTIANLRPQIGRCSQKQQKKSNAYCIMFGTTSACCLSIHESLKRWKWVRDPQIPLNDANLVCVEKFCLGNTLLEWSNYVDSDGFKPELNQIITLPSLESTIFSKFKLKACQFQMLLLLAALVVNTKNI